MTEPLRLTVGYQGGWDAFPAVEAPAAPKGENWDAFPAVSTAEDIHKTLPASLARGAARVLGAPADLTNFLLGWGEWAEQKIRGETDEQFARRTAERKQAAGFDANKVIGKFGYQNIKEGIEGTLGKPLYEPQTTPGRYVGSVAEALPGAILGPGNMARNAIAFGVAPGIVGETADIAAEKYAPSLRPYAKPVAEVATGGLGAYATRGGATGGMIARDTRGITPDQLDTAERLFQQSHVGPNPTPLTRQEAIDLVTGNASGLSGRVRMVEGHGGLRDFYSQRPGQNAAASQEAFERFGARAQDPYAIGPQVGTAAEESVNSVRQRINAVSDPYYRSAENVRLTQQEMSQVRALPGYPEARDAVRNDPQLNRHVAHLPENSVGFLNEVKKYLDTAAENAASTVQQGRNMQRSAGYGQDAAAVRQAGVNASPDYAAALALQEHGRSRFLEPLMQGPLGKLAERDLPTKKAIQVLFPSDPLAHSAQQIGEAVGEVAARNPGAARQLVRQYLEKEFSETANTGKGVASESGGARFAANVSGGNQERAANLEAAVRALPNGDQIYPGLDRFLTFMRAQGHRPDIGSRTAFNQADQQAMAGGATRTVVGTALGVGVKLPGKVLQAFENWNTGRNLNELSYLLTAPEAAARFRQLATARTDGQALALISRLGFLATSEPGKKQSRPVNQAR